MARDTLNVLVLGASYGLLPAVRCALAGHRVSVVCRPQEQSALAQEGVELWIRRRDGKPASRLSVPAVAGDRGAVGTIGLVVPEAVRVSEYDMILLAMAEPQFASSELTDLIARIGLAGKPVISLMNMAPSSYLRRIPHLVDNALDKIYAAHRTWSQLYPENVTAASPDAQALRMEPDKPGQITVTLASNFKVAPFANPVHQGLLLRLCQDIAASQGNGIAPPIRLIASPGLFVPLSKWPMLIAGNYRCIRADRAPVSIAEAVHRDPEASRRIYDQICTVLLRAGAEPAELVPFARYAAAAQQLQMPSSVARSLAAGGTMIERVDLLVAAVTDRQGVQIPELEAIAASVQHTLDANREKGLHR